MIRGILRSKWSRRVADFPQKNEDAESQLPVHAMRYKYKAQDEQFIYKV